MLTCEFHTGELIFSSRHHLADHVHDTQDMLAGLCIWDCLVILEPLIYVQMTMKWKAWRRGKAYLIIIVWKCKDPDTKSMIFKDILEYLCRIISKSLPAKAHMTFYDI